MPTSFCVALGDPSLLIIFWIVFIPRVSHSGKLREVKIILVRSEWTCCAGILRNGADHIVRTKWGTHRPE